MKRIFLFAILLIPTALFADWKCNVKLVDDQTVSILMAELDKIRFTDEDNITFFKTDKKREKFALESIDNISFEEFVSVNDIDSEANIIYPNPAVDIINVKGCAGLDYVVINLSSAKVLEGAVAEGDVIDVSSLEAGTFILVLSNRSAFRFIKR